MHAETQHACQWQTSNTDLLFITYLFLGSLTTYLVRQNLNSELEEQQRLAYELTEQIKSMEDDEKNLLERVKVLEAKLQVQGLLEKVEAKRVVVNQLRNRVSELEGRLKNREGSPLQEQVAPPQEEKVRKHF